jgi:uncharacterized protein YjeT (DUF2065 family)
MLYSVSLRTVSLLIGLGHLALGILLASVPRRVGSFLAILLRNGVAGQAASLFATAWATFLCLRVDLGELSPLRWQITLACLTLGFLVSWLLVELLLIRAFGVILLLAAEIPLEAAFLADSPYRAVVSGVAYAWILGGISMVLVPYYWREVLDRLAANPSRFGRGVGVLFTLLGLLLSALSLVVFQE